VPLDTRSLDYEVYFERGDVLPQGHESFNSHNARRLNVDEVIDLLNNNAEFKEYVKHLK